MEDPRIGRLLRELPEERAGVGFTARVLERLDEPRRRRAPDWQPRFAAAAAAALLLVALTVTMGLLRRPEPAAGDAQEALRELRDEHVRLQRELQALHEMRQAAPAEEPVLYLGGNEEIDLVVNLGTVQEAEGATPAAYHEVTY